VTPLRKRCKIALSKLTPAPPAPHVPNRWRESSSTSHDLPTICRHTPCRATQHPLREASSPEQRSLGKGARPPPRATCVSTPIPRCPFPTRPVPHERGARERHRRRKREQEVEVEVDVEERASGYTTTSAPSTEHPDPHLGAASPSVSTKPARLLSRTSRFRSQIHCSRRRGVRDGPPILNLHRVWIDGGMGMTPRAAGKGFGSIRGLRGGLCEGFIPLSGRGSSGPVCCGEGE
jgi:hypothetical protein